MTEVAEPGRDGIARELLNIQYSVFLGVALSLSFYVDTSAPATIRPVLNPGRVESLLFMLYFLLDWFTANIVERRRFPRPGHLFLRVTWVTILGATAISLNGSGLWKFVLLSGYLIGSGLYDLWFMWGLFDNRASTKAVTGLLFAGSRLLIGLTFLAPTLSAAALGRADVLQSCDDPADYNDFMSAMIASYVALKLGRFLYLVKVPQGVPERLENP